ncbi:MAG: Hsp20/alpha crystallin family protein [Chromatiaceae bacterium]|nr:Hsp20/alpha crystallin family protein [Chromatiaceae bacterium]MCF7997132.1 Hsp20/alpha crystallin family protein [Chromatiaceae bacterium]MCF8004827.1 Hsp20/alpha crystallin family protein [Chromatiaceae bacterium]MCF8016266.1 Hsp20/alpha crystallin family protein [Chromatiaceae bacterium]
MSTKEKSLKKETGRKQAQTLQVRENRWLDDMDRAFDRMMNRGVLQPFRSLWPDWAPFQPDLDIRVPRVDMVDRDDELLIRAEVPGIDKEHLHLDLAGDLLTIHGERQHEETQEGDHLYRSEIVHGAFSRSIRLPTGLNTEAVDASFKNGILEVHLPKREETKRQKIEVN